MAPIKKVEVINKPTLKQMADSKIEEIEERIAKQDIDILELRNRMIEIRKDFAKFEGRIEDIAERITRQDNTIFGYVKPEIVVRELMSNSSEIATNYKDHDSGDDKTP